mgnify:CR=1 FL=1
MVEEKSKTFVLESNKEEEGEKVVMNMRQPKNIKDDFSKNCEERGTSVTDEIKHMMMSANRGETLEFFQKKVDVQGHQINELENVNKTLIEENYNLKIASNIRNVETKTINVKVPVEWHKKIKASAAENGTTIGQAFLCLSNIEENLDLPSPPKPMALEAPPTVA